jgi:hypothetical protein
MHEDAIAMIHDATLAVAAAIARRDGAPGVAEKLEAMMTAGGREEIARRRSKQRNGKPAGEAA